MGKKTARIIVWLVLAVPAVIMSSDNYQVVDGPKDFYYGHVSLVDIRNDGKDPLVFREGAAGSEIAVLNFPLGPGDTIRTSDVRRCEIQFDNATIVRLDVDTELKIETILAQSLSSRNKMSNLVLRRGRIYAMYKEYSGSEVFQILTSSLAVKLRHDSVAQIAVKDDGSTDVQVEYGKAVVRFGSDPARPAEKAVYKSEQLTVLADQTFAFGEFTSASDFDLWNKEINGKFPALHKGLTPLPKPVQRLPKAVFYFAQTFGNVYGEWLYDDLYGYVWRPYYNDYYPWGSWQPYHYGRWASYGGQMFWVPDEPWGWVPYHLGVWQWDEKRGWFWMPGSAFSPAWVDWAFFGGSYYAWRPWSIWDWMWYDDFALFYGIGGPGFPDYYGWRYGGLYGGPTYDLNDPARRQMNIRTLDKIRKDQLKSPGDPALPITKEFRKTYNVLREALARGDARAVGSVRNLSKQTVVVGAKDLASARIHTVTTRLETVLHTARNMPAGNALRTVLGLPPQSGPASLFLAAKSFERSGAFSGRPGTDSVTRTSRALPSGLRSAVLGRPERAHDWNPDVRIGRKLGVDILYTSRTNEIYSPQLRISSAMAGLRPILDSNGIIHRSDRSRGGSDSSPGSSSPGSSSFSGSGASSGAAGSASTGSASSGSSSSGGGSGHIR